MSTHCRCRGSMGCSGLAIREGVRHLENGSTTELYVPRWTTIWLRLALLRPSVARPRRGSVPQSTCVTLSQVQHTELSVPRRNIGLQLALLRRYVTSKREARMPKRAGITSSKAQYTELLFFVGRIPCACCSIYVHKLASHGWSGSLPTWNLKESAAIPNDNPQGVEKPKPAGTEQQPSRASCAPLSGQHCTRMRAAF